MALTGSPRGRVVLAHADPALAARVDHAVGEPPLPVARGRRRRQRLRRGRVRRLAIEAAVGEVGEVDRAVPHGPRSAAIFVHARARVVGRRRDVGLTPIGFGTHHDGAAAFLRPPFQPIDVPAVEPHVRQCDRLRDDEVRRDRRFPGAVGRGFGRGGWHGSSAFAVPDGSASYPVRDPVGRKAGFF